MRHKKEIKELYSNQKKVSNEIITHLTNKKETRNNY